MKSTNVDSRATTRKGVRAFGAFLYFAEHGQHLVDLADDTFLNIESSAITANDFELSVAQMLEPHGYECDFKIGSAGYFIDLAVKHPENPGEYIMGIESDGKTYAESKSTRDRDCLKEEVLESLGWNIRKIWVSDWLSNPKGVIAKLVKDLAKIQRMNES